MVISLSACSSFGVDKEAIEKTVTRIKSDELDLAINVINEMNEKTLLAGKSEILTAVIGEISTYLDQTSWLITEYDLVNKRVIEDIEKYQIIVNSLLLEDDESNVDDFITKAISLKEYVKWNDFYGYDATGTMTNISDIMNRGSNYKSTPSIALKYYKEAYDECMYAYKRCSEYTGYGMKELADFYYNYAIRLNASITRIETTSEQNDAFNTSSSNYEHIMQEYSDDLELVTDIGFSFPKKLY